MGVLARQNKVEVSAAIVLVIDHLPRRRGVRFRGRNSDLAGGRDVPIAPNLHGQAFK